MAQKPMLRAEVWNDTNPNARALRKQSKCGMIQEGRRERGIGQIPRKFAKSEGFMGVAHSAEQ